MQRAVLVFAVCWSIPVQAGADVPPPGLTECHARAVGDACIFDGADGTCQQSECGRLDYSQGTPPRSVSYPCVVCTPTPPPAGGDSAGGCSVGVGAAPSMWPLALAFLACVARRRRQR